MKKVNSLQVFLFCNLFFFLCCTIEKKSIIEDKSTSIFLNEQKTSIMDTTIFTTCKYIPLETTTSSVMYGCDRILIDKDTLFVWDKRFDAIHLFNLSGKHLSRIYHKGEGPYEYSKIRDVSIDTIQNQIIVSCDPQKLLIYDYQGNGLCIKKLPDDLNEIVYHNGYIYGYENINDAQMDISVYDKDNVLLSKYQIDRGVSLRKREANTIYNFGRGQRMTSNRGCYLTNQFDNSIYQLVEDSIYKLYEINFFKHEFPIQLLEQNTSSEIRDLCEKNKYICSISEVVNNENYLFFRTNIGFCIYDKCKKELNGYSLLRSSKLKIGTSEILSTNDENILIGIFNSESLMSFIEYKMKNDKKWIEENPNFISLFKNVDNESNPILVLFKFK